MMKKNYVYRLFVEKLKITEEQKEATESHDEPVLQLEELPGTSAVTDENTASTSGQAKAGKFIFAYTV